MFLKSVVSQVNSVVPNNNQYDNHRLARKNLLLKPLIFDKLNFYFHLYYNFFWKSFFWKSFSEERNIYEKIDFTFKRSTFMLEIYHFNHLKIIIFIDNYRWKSGKFLRNCIYWLFLPFWCKSVYKISLLL